MNEHPTELEDAVSPGDPEFSDRAKLGYDTQSLIRMIRCGREVAYEECERMKNALLWAWDDDTPTPALLILVSYMLGQQSQKQSERERRASLLRAGQVSEHE